MSAGTGNCALELQHLVDGIQHRCDQREASIMSSKKARRMQQAHQFVESHRNELSTQMMCGLVGVARAGDHPWRDHPMLDRAREDARLLRLIRASFTASDGSYRNSRTFLDPREVGEACSKDKRLDSCARPACTRSTSTASAVSLSPSRAH